MEDDDNTDDDRQIITLQYIKFLHTWPLLACILRFIHFQKVLIPALNPNTVPMVHTVARR